MPVPENPVYHRRNYFLAAIEGGFFMGGMAFLSMESVMPAMIRELGGPVWMIAISPVLFFIGFCWPQVFSALWVERLYRMKPMLLGIGYVQRSPYLIAGLFLIFLGSEYPSTSLLLVFLAPLLSSTLGGIQGSGFFELLTRIVPVNRTASMWAIRNVLWALIGISAGFAIKIVLDRHPGTVGYGILHLCTFSMMMVSIFVLSLVKENTIPDHRDLPRLTFRKGFASIKRLFRDNPSVVRFVITRMFTTTIFVVVPFLAIRAIDRTGEPSSLVGLLVLIQMVGFISGNVLAGYLGDRMGTRIPMLLARIALLFISLSGPFAIEIWHFMAIFFLLGFGLSTAQVGDITMVFDFAPRIRRKFYYAVMATLLVPGMLASSLLSAILLNMESGFSIACLIAVAGLAFSLHQLFLLKDPRHAGSVP